MKREWCENLEIVGHSDKGMVREQNEDRIYFNQELGFAIVADGVGGHRAGEVASSLAVTTISSALSARIPSLATATDAELLKLLADHLHAANRAINQLAEEQQQYQGMGSAIVVALVHRERLVVGHVGDCRLYRVRGGQISQLTRDHTFLQELVKRGSTVEQARAAINPHLLTQALGTQSDVEPSVAVVPLEPGDSFLLCSDGLTDMLDDQIIGRIIDSTARFAATATLLVAEANAAGGRDNVSVVVLRIAGNSRPGWWKKIFR